MACGLRSVPAEPRVPSVTGDHSSPPRAGAGSSGWHTEHLALRLAPAGLPEGRWPLQQTTPSPPPPDAPCSLQPCQAGWALWEGPGQPGLAPTSDLFQIHSLSKPLAGVTAHPQHSWSHDVLLRHGRLTICPPPLEPSLRLGLGWALLPGTWLPAFRESWCVQGVCAPTRCQPQAPAPRSLVGSRPRPDEDAQAMRTHRQFSPETNGEKLLKRASSLCFELIST